MTMRVVINGTARDVESNLTIAGLLAQLGLDARQLAVERNLELAPRAEHADVVLQEGDRIEIVTLVGGG